MRYTLSDREFTFFSQMVYRINSLTGYEEVAATVLKQLQIGRASCRERV